MRGRHAQFWNREYRSGEHLALSDEPSEDLEKFCRWLERNHGRAYLNVTARVLDLGCGNGRNLVFLAKTYGMRGVGYDISSEAIAQAKRASLDLPVEYAVRAIQGVIDLPDASVDIVLDMMTSHFLDRAEREHLRGEVLRVLKPGGWFFFKTFLADQDLHAKRLLKEHPSGEAGTYIHPKLGVREHVVTEDELYEFFGDAFEVFKVERSHKHMSRGKAFKRRTVAAYLRKNF